MDQIYGAYLEDYHYIKIILPKDEPIDLRSMVLLGNQESQTLHVFHTEWFGAEFHIHASFLGKICLQIDYQVVLSNTISYHLSLGKIIHTKRFDIENVYEGPLGVEYHPNQSIFRVWSPVAKELILICDEGEFPMIFRTKGLWEVTVGKDCDHLSYYYKIRVNETFSKTLDPYGNASAGNHQHNYVIDPDKTYQMKYPKPYDKQSFHHVDAIIYELHIRDFTMDLPVLHPGTYQGMVESEQLVAGGMLHLKSLGITHVQLLPIFGFGGVDESIKEESTPGFQYNWGYNPIQYFVPSGWYASDCTLPYARIDECKQMIDTFHKHNFAVNMDVVYNHVYESSQFALDILVPGYAYRIDKQGFMTNGSGCGNDLASERPMIRRLILDSLQYWQTFYHIDGFRFDLMGLLDIETINQAVKRVLQHAPTAMIYGEGWQMPSPLPDDQKAIMKNFWQMPHVAYFNDRFRNTMKSDFDGRKRGYAMGGNYHPFELSLLIKGSCEGEWLFASPEQSINYLECHDNYTFVDQLVRYYPDLSTEKTLDYVRLGLGIVLLSQGIPFLHAGEEFMRSKKGVDNSYASPDDINKLDWSLCHKQQDVVQTCRDLIRLRKEYACFRLETESDVKHHIKVKEYETVLMLRYFDAKSQETLQVFFKNDYEETKYFFAPHTYLLFDGKSLQDMPVDHFLMSHPGVYIFKK